MKETQSHTAFSHNTGGDLVWNKEAGIGFYPVSKSEYGAEYWKKYQEYRNSPIALNLIKERIGLVQRHHGNESLIDIGIGSGHFLERRGGQTYGYDVNPMGIQWLLDRGVWWDPYFKDPAAISCWDSLEHIERPCDLLSRVSKFVFVSIPIFRNRDHVLTSKHFKPKEHFWYFTEAGFEGWMRRLGFEILEKNTFESELGREDIKTFAFMRVNARDHLAFHS